MLFLIESSKSHLNENYNRSTFSFQHNNKSFVNTSFMCHDPPPLPSIQMQGNVSRFRLLNAGLHGSLYCSFCIISRHCFLCVQVAELIRLSIDAHLQPVPAVLEIPSKDHPYDASKDSILRRAKVSNRFLLKR